MKSRGFVIDIIEFPYLQGERYIYWLPMVRVPLFLIGKALCMFIYILYIYMLNYSIEGSLIS